MKRFRRCQLAFELFAASRRQPLVQALSNEHARLEHDIAVPMIVQRSGALEQSLLLSGADPVEHASQGIHGGGLYLGGCVFPHGLEERFRKLLSPVETEFSADPGADGSIGIAEQMSLQGVRYAGIVDADQQAGEDFDELRPSSGSMRILHGRQQHGDGITLGDQKFLFGAIPLLLAAAEKIDLLVKGGAATCDDDEVDEKEEFEVQVRRAEPGSGQQVLFSHGW